MQIKNVPKENANFYWRRDDLDMLKASAAKCNVSMSDFVLAIARSIAGAKQPVVKVTVDGGEVDVDAFVKCIREFQKSKYANRAQKSLDRKAKQAKRSE